MDRADTMIAKICPFSASNLTPPPATPCRQPVVQWHYHECLTHHQRSCHDGRQCSTLADLETCQRTAGIGLGLFLQRSASSQGSASICQLKLPHRLVGKIRCQQGALCETILRSWRKGGTEVLIVVVTVTMMMNIYLLPSHKKKFPKKFMEQKK